MRRLGLAILADGMGGYNAGEVASGMATTLLAGSLVGTLQRPRTATGRCRGRQRGPSPAARPDRRHQRRDLFCRTASAEIGYGMGTTLVVAWFYDNHLTVAHIGDSRLYRLRGNRFERLTRDHSLLQEQLDNGIISPEEAAFSVSRNLVTRALGVDLRRRVRKLQDFEVRRVMSTCSAPTA
jgi:serine/threonine protein phosphatase PrpC